MAVVITKQHEEMENYDILSAKNEIVAQYTGSEEVDKLTTEIEVYNTDSIIKFGSGVADEVSKASDVVLNGMNLKQLNDTGAMFDALNKVMEQFNIEEIKDDPKGFKKIFNNAEKHLKKLLSKYDNMGKEIEKIYVQLKGYEDEIQRSNNTLGSMFDACKEQYHKLELYILAGEQGIDEIQKAIETEQAKADNGDSEAQFTVQNLQQAKQLLEQRVQDLRISENIAMQSIPMIKTMEFSNYNLMRKIDSAFIITLPIFKQSIAQAMLLKRQKIQADAMSALDARTNELLLKNAQNSASQTAEIARMSSTSSIKIETIEESWRTIMNGIEETRKIQQEASVKREEDKKRLAELKNEFKNRR